MKKILALILSAALMLALVACGGSAPASTSSSAAPAPAKAEEAAPAQAEAAEAPAAAKSFQFTGTYVEEGANAAMLNAAFLLNLNEDGTAVADRYQFAQYDASPAASNPSYQASYMSGTWKEVEKDGIPCLQIKLAYVDASGASSNDQTAYAYDVAGEYSFDLTFPIVPGMSYSRVAPMVGSEQKVFADADAFIAAYKLDFVEPESIAKFASDEATIYIQENGSALLYLGTSQAAEGKWSSEDGLKIELDGQTYDVAVDGNAGKVSFSRDRGDGVMVDYEVSCEDVTSFASAEAPAAEAPAAEAPAEDAPYTGATIDLGGNKFDPSLVLNPDGTAKLTVAMGMDVLYTRVGDVVALVENADAPLEGYGISIFGAVPHAWKLDDETKTMTALKDAFFFMNDQAQLSFFSEDGEQMSIALPAYGMSADGFTYSLSEDGKVLTVNPPEDLDGGFSQVWSALNISTFNVDGALLTPAA